MKEKIENYQARIRGELILLRKELPEAELNYTHATAMILSEGFDIDATEAQALLRAMLILIKEDKYV